MQRYLITRQIAENNNYHFYKKKRNTEYYINPETGYAIVFTNTERYGEQLIATTIELCEKLDYSCISLKYNASCIDNPVPMTAKAYKGIHRLMFPNIPKDKEIDHCFTSRLFCAPKGLRLCTHEENSHNKIDTIKTLYPTDYGYYYIVKTTNPSEVNTLVNQYSFRQPKASKNRRADSKICMKSPYFPTKEAAYIHMRAVNEALYGEYAYKLEEDFSHEYGIHLLINCFLLKTLTQSQMLNINKQYWKQVLPEYAGYMY